MRAAPRSQRRGTALRRRRARGGPRQPPRAGAKRSGEIRAAPAGRRLPGAAGASLAVEAPAEDEAEERPQRRNDTSPPTATPTMAISVGRPAAASSTLRPGSNSGRCARDQPATTTTDATAPEAPKRAASERRRLTRVLTRPDVTLGLRRHGWAARRRDGAFMEQSGRNPWQPVANGAAAKTAQTGENRCRLGCDRLPRT
jgi:hypothetical protein